MRDASVSALIAVVFVACAAGWFVLAHTVLSAVILLVAGVLCLVWLLATQPSVQRGALYALMILASATLLYAMWLAALALALAHR